MLINHKLFVTPDSDGNPSGLFVMLQMEEVPTHKKERGEGGEFLGVQRIEALKYNAPKLLELKA